MNSFDRRTFLQLSTGALLAAASSNLQGQGSAPQIVSKNGSIKVEGPNYSWEYSQANDTFSLRDSKGRLMVTGTVQPAIVVAPVANPASRECTLGKIAGHRIEADRVSFDYEGVNGMSRVSVTWRFDRHGPWIEPIVYESATAHDVVSLHYFANANGTSATPSLNATYLVLPGISEGSSISPIVPSGIRLDQDIRLGNADTFGAGMIQQWALPVHFFSGFSVDLPHPPTRRDEFTQGMSDAFACGLADLPDGDLAINLDRGKSSMWVDYRSDLWHHLRGPGKLTLGATLFWAIGANYHDAIGQYYQGLLQANVVRGKIDSPRKTAAALTPQYCTWGAQSDRNKGGDKLDEAFLTEIYKELQDSGMKAGMFSIDDKWEGSYGSLMHSEARFPHFEQFLDRVRADGHRIGMWAAPLRCEDPAVLGLTLDNMLKGPDGKPSMAASFSKSYLFDFTQPKVAEVLSDVARRFIRRYKPDLFKFDFGYDLPLVSEGAPSDKSWMGERLMWKGLDVIIRAMKEENPDLAVMYYSLSPLYLDYFDLNGTDDMYLAAGEYDLEANRRMFFSSPMGLLGIPTYGSSGYDWASSPSIWFDSAAVGTLGSLNDFREDEQGETGAPELIAKYNGLTYALRASNKFKVVPLDVVYEAPTRGAHARSWARMENGQLVLLAFRPGDRNPLAAPVAIAGIEDAVRSSAPVVVASKSKDGIARAANLAVVPYGSGEISIRRQQGRQAEALSHYFDGTVVKSQSRVVNGRLKIVAEQRNGALAPLEWIELLIT